MDTFTKAYIDAALWSSIDDNDEPLDSGEHELASETLDRMIADCEKFQSENEEWISPEYCNSRYGTDAQAGHDFWLTRCGYGCGFWDGDWEEPAASSLTDSATAFGNIDLYIGDDGLIYG